MLLKEIAMLKSPSGYEFEIRNYIKKHLDKIGCKYHIDRMGNVIAHNKGKETGNKIMITAPMDEYAFIVTGFDDDGFIKFKGPDEIDMRYMVAKTVYIGEGNIKGVIGSKLFMKVDRNRFSKPFEIDELYLDIGADSKQDAMSRVNIGDRVVFRSNYVELGNNKLKFRSADTKASSVVLMELLSKKLDIDFYACFSTMSKVSVLGEYDFLGAKTASFALDPDFIISISGVLSSDTPNSKECKRTSKLGEGVVFSISEDSFVADKRIIDKAKSIADEKSIKYQYKNTNIGSSGAKTLTQVKNGKKVLSLGIPCRYMDTAISTIDKTDVENTISLLEYMLIDGGKNGY